MATIGQQVFKQKEFVSEGTPRRHQAANAIHSFRPIAERELIRLKLPECKIGASDQDIKSFVSWWIGVLESVSAKRLSDGEIQEIKRLNDPANAEHFLRSYNKFLDDVEHDTARIEAESEMVRSVAVQEVEQWQRLECIQSHYNGDRFFERDVFGMARNVRHEKEVLIVRRGMKGLLFPAKSGTPEPLASLEAFFLEAESEGLLSFKNKKHRKVFFSRYQEDGPLPKHTVKDADFRPYWGKHD